MLPIFSVSEFLNQVNDIILGKFVIEGEVSGFKVSQGKWAFFDLKDDYSTVNCFAVFFRLKIPIEDGMKIRVVGYPKIREQNGRFSFTVESAEIVGDGSIQKAYKILKNKLSEEGLFDVSRKRSIPEIPKRIGLIASRDSAAFGDFVRILNNRWGGLEIVLCHVLVQGNGAVKDIVSAFNKFNKDFTNYDVLVLIRGGGSIEDLASFSTEEVARAVYGSKIPVICGIGHERDESLADLVSDRVASTPSNAAEIVVPNAEDFTESIDFAISNLGQILFNEVSKYKYEIDKKIHLISIQLVSPLQNCSLLVNKFLGLTKVLSDAVNKRISFVEYAEKLLKNINPKVILKRGYSIIKNTKGEIICNADKIGINDEFVVEFAESKMDAKKIEKK